MPITATLSPNWMSASSAPWKPVGTMSEIIAAAARSIPSGRCAKLPSASFTWKYSAKTPSLKLENFQPESMPPECIAKPSCACLEFQSGVIADTSTLSPTLKSRTRLPTSTTSPTASWPRIILDRSPIAPAQTVCMSEVQGASASGLQIASIGPHLGISFSIQPVAPIFNIAKPFMVYFLLIL